MTTTTLSFNSPAKINWYLEVLDLRPDGYHEILTVFHELELGDELVFELLDDPVCEISGFVHLPPEKNLIYRAWEELRGVFPQVRGVRVSATKRIPAGGGLGGGSSNAATTLKALVRLSELACHPGQLEAIAEKLGSDVPFFLQGGCARGQGRGEKLTTIVPPAMPICLVLVFPDQKVSTADAYRTLDGLARTPRRPERLAQLEAAIGQPDCRQLARLIWNDFEAVVQQYQWYEEAISALNRAGALRSFLTGSGSTVVGLAEDNDHADGMVQQLRSQGYKTISTKAVARANG